MKGITASRAEIDFGEVEKNSQSVQTIRLLNESGENIRMIPFKSCGCTNPILERDKLEPGESTNFKIIFDSTGKSGYQEKSVGVNYYLNGEPQKLTIKFKVKIKK